MDREHDAAGAARPSGMGHARLWISICLVLVLLLAAIAVGLFGLSLWTAAVVALLAACPLVIAWGVLTGFGSGSGR